MSGVDIKEQKPSTHNQIKAQKPNVPKSETVATGFTAGSFNGGHNKPVHYQYVMAGQKIKKQVWDSKIKLLTPKSPSYQTLWLNVTTYFVPFSRVWKNYEEFAAQKGGANETKIAEMPNIGGKKIPTIYTNDDSYVTVNNTIFWKNCFTEFYIPRNSDMILNSNPNLLPRTMPKYNALTLRACTAIYNDYLRYKELRPEVTEYINDDTVSEAEWESYFPTDTENLYYLKWRALLPDSYYTNFRVELQGMATPEPSMNNTSQNLLYWIQYENLTDYVRQQSLDSMKNDWEIVAELRGTRPALQKQVQIIGRKTVPLNYSAVTQNTYNNNENLDENYRALGQQGAYSYTEVKIPTIEYFEAIEDGVIITIANVFADTCFTSAFDRQSLNVNAMDRYRPDLASQKTDILYAIENGTNFRTTAEETLRLPGGNASSIGFKRKFSELFCLPNVAFGDMVQNPYYKIDNGTGTNLEDEYIVNEEMTTISNNTFTFFENSRFNYYEDGTGFAFDKKPYWDYTDLMLDKNMAVKEEKVPIVIGGDDVDFLINGDDQIYYVGKMICITDIPVDESIKNDFTKWGEH